MPATSNQPNSSQPTLDPSYCLASHVMLPAAPITAQYLPQIPLPVSTNHHAPKESLRQIYGPPAHSDLEKWEPVRWAMWYWPEGQAEESRITSL